MTNIADTFANHKQQAELSKREMMECLGLNELQVINLANLNSSENHLMDVLRNQEELVRNLKNEVYKFKKDIPFKLPNGRAKRYDLNEELKYLRDIITVKNKAGEEKENLNNFMYSRFEGDSTIERKENAWDYIQQSRQKQLKKGA